MAKASEADDSTFPMRAVVKLTGLTPDLLRAWERRYAVVDPIRTPGGTRRYRNSDIERLQLVKAVVDAGYRIGDIAKLDADALRARLDAPPATGGNRVDDVIDALDRLDAPAAERLIAFQLSTLGPGRFAREFAVPLLEEIGHAWQNSQICVASEHLGSGVLRSLLGSALRPTRVSLQAPPVLFVTPSGERHELGLLIAALTALGAGGNPVYLGPDLPSGEIVRAAERVDAAAVAFSVAFLDTSSARKAIEATREALADDVEVWVGGRGAAAIGDVPEIHVFESLDELERRIGLLGYRG